MTWRDLRHLVGAGTLALDLAMGYPASAQTPALPPTTAVRFIGASVTLDGAAAMADGTTVSNRLTFGTTSTAFPVLPGRHTVSVGKTSTTLSIPEDCTVNVVAADRQSSGPAELVPVPACDDRRIPPGASRLTVLVASDEPSKVRATLGDAQPVDIEPFQVSAPLEPAAGPAKLTLASAATGAPYATADTNFAAGTATLAVFLGEGDEAFRILTVFDGIQPQAPPLGIEINTGPSDTAPTVPLAAALACVLAILAAMRRGWQ